MRPALLIEAFQHVRDQLVSREAGDVATAFGGAGAGHKTPFLRAPRLGRLQSGEGRQRTGGGGEAVGLRGGRE